MKHIHPAVFVLVTLLPVCAHAGQSGAPAAAVSVAGVQLPFTYDGPAPPALPATMARDAEGRTTVRAIRLDAPLRVDGLLDEALYTTVTPISGFIQAEPRPGTPESETTEVWISFDEDNVYVSVRASESQPERMVLNEMRRDSNSTWQNENFGFAFDTFYDRRNSVMFQFTPIGGWADGQNVNEGQYNSDWNPIWTFKVRRNAGGWTGEAAVPFKSLKYRPGQSQIWGVQLRRISRWRNESAYLTRLPDGVGGSGSGLTRTSRSATLVGIEAPPGSRALDIKPYVTSALSTDRTVTPRIQNAFGKDAGFDVKYGVTQNLTADFTYNTDFAQVEADEQQVNLTRFSLFFPEKRDFFIENQGLFNFGGAGGFAGGGDLPILFYSRRIGLDRGALIPIDGGGRLTGRIGRVSVGLVNMQTGDLDRLGVPSTNFAVARVRRDILRRSAVGALVTRRSTTVAGTGSAETYGLDGSFAFFSNLTMNAYWAKTQNPGVTADNTSYRGQFNYNADRYGLEMAHLKVGDNFAPGVGFVRRDNIHRSYGLARFSPRPRNNKLVRKFAYEGSLTYIENGQGALETREARGEFRVEFFNSDSVELSVTDGYELLPAPFRIARGVTIPAGGYDLRTVRGQYSLGQQWKASGTLFAEHGPFYDGDRTAFGYSGARVKVNPRLAVEPGISINRVTLPYGAFTTKLVSSRTTFTVTPFLFVSGLVQYNTSNNTMATNARLRWEYHAGSELFVVYNDGRDTLPRGFPDLQNRSLVVKINRLFRL